MAARIKKGDKVVVISGRDKGRSGEVIKVMPKEEPRAGARRQHGDAASEADGGGAGRARPQGSADPPVERRDRRSDRRQADARRLQDRSRTAARSASPSVRERLSMAEAKEAKPGKKAKAAEGAGSGRGAAEERCRTTSRGCRNIIATSWCRS